MTKKNGFTLVEMLLVITIVTILFTITTVTYTDLIGKTELQSTSEQLADMLISSETAARYNRNNADWSVEFQLAELPKQAVLTNGEIILDKLTIPNKTELLIEPNTDKITFSQNTGAAEHTSTILLSNDSGIARVKITETGLILSE